MKEIYIPHLHYAIKYGVNKKEVSSDASITTENTNSSTATIFFKSKPNVIDMPTVAHEIMHVLQFICRNRNIVMENELEHMGYLMQYLLAQIYGLELYVK